MNQTDTYKTLDSTILYGVPKVGYGIYGSTPYPICLKSCLNYLGEDLDYAIAMVLSSAAFRLSWDRTCWNLGNVDVQLAYDEENAFYGVAAKALGRDFDLLIRTPKTTKEEFKDFIISHISKGFPCIALGIIGPPEACIVTGYRENGDTLLGWNFFADDPQFGGLSEKEDCGYFLCTNWWENLDTQAVMCIGDKTQTPLTFKEIIGNAITVLTGRSCDVYEKGIAAYDAWKTALLSKVPAAKPENYSIATEQLMCMDDAMVCLLDGRGNAAPYFNYISHTDAPYAELCGQAAFYSDAVFKQVQGMVDLFGGWENPEDRLNRFLDPDFRSKLAEQIDLAKANDEKLLHTLHELYNSL